MEAEKRPSKLRQIDAGGSTAAARADAARVGA
jgi:hypothetical protein